MDKKHTLFSSGQVTGAAVKQTGEILRPFITNRPDLLALIDGIETPEEMAAWYPVSDLMTLLDIAREHSLFQGLAKSWALNVLQRLLKKKEVMTPEGVLEIIEKGFPIQHRGHVGRLSIRMTGGQSAEIVDSTYVPCGYLIAMVERAILGYGAKEIEITHGPGQCKNHGAPACTYMIEWTESDLLKLVKE